MDSFVSARVPSEKKTQVNSILREIGSTQTDLVNAAYDYVLAYGKLPSVSKAEPGLRRLGPAEREAVRQWMAQTTFPALGKQFANDYKDLIAKGRAADYEALP